MKKSVNVVLQGALEAHLREQGLKSLTVKSMKVENVGDGLLVAYHTSAPGGYTEWRVAFVIEPFEVGNTRFRVEWDHTAHAK